MWLRGKPYIVWLLFLIGLANLLILPVLVQEGMFLDATLYASFARNLAEGIGSFWQIKYHAQDSAIFYGHPPLGFWFQSLWFKLFGDYLFVERLYSYLSCLASLFLIILIFRCCLPKYKQYAWFSALLWLVCPVVFWSYQNNMLENSFGFCCLLAVFAAIKWMEDDRLSTLFIYASLFSVGLIIALMIKGPVALFPLIAPILLLIAYPKKSSLVRIGIGYIICLTYFTLFGFYIHSTPEAYQFTIEYINCQIEPSFNGRKEIAESRFHILSALFNQLITIIIISSLAILAAVRLKLKMHHTQKRWAIFFLGLGLSASLPFLLTPKQMLHYLTPSIPYFALASAVICVPILIALSKKLAAKQACLNTLAALIFIASLIPPVFTYGKYARHEKRITDIKEIIAISGKDQLLNCSESLLTQWSIQAYLNRYGKVGFNNGDALEYLLVHQQDLKAYEEQTNLELLTPNANECYLFKRVDQ